ncbi:hypothetical protein QTP70_000921 [Hemibagrus guttatus]|uniref:Uncharacterized protein n=1 Tax=Hemibagrus guttatus TaxID=175788 RepID=A0AAE0UIX2_9TELE|nr:hypothetical protein QTP70_000921 [Hemibagrus guttatus]
MRLPVGAPAQAHKLNTVSKVKPSSGGSIPDLEAFTIDCKLFYSPREFSSFILVGVYIPPQGNVRKAQHVLADEIQRVEQTNPDVLVIVLGDFNKAKLRQLRSENEATFESGDKGKYKEDKYRFSKENITDPLLDPLQFTYRANRSVDDAVNMALHFILQHLDFPGSYARILFVDFSSVLNTIIPALLRDKLF